MAFASFRDFDTIVPDFADYLVGYNPLRGEYKTQIIQLSSILAGGGFGAYSIVFANSANWNSVYTSVKDTSAIWDSVYTSVKNNSANWDSVYTSVKNSSATWDSVYTSVKDNSATYATINFVDGKFLPLSGGEIDGNLTINGSLTALGDAYFVNTIFTTTSAVSVINTGYGPALYVFQAAGPYDVASFYDGDGIEVLHVGNAQGGGNPRGKVGINESYPATELTVRGSVSASGIITVNGGNSNNWNSAYTTVSAFSATWGGVTQIVAGSNISINPPAGTGVVTINSTGGGGGGGLDIASLTNYLSTNVVYISAMSVFGAVTAADYFLTANGTYPVQTFNGDGITTNFNLLCAVYSANDLHVFVSGVYQRKDTYTIPNPYTISFSEAPPSGASIIEITNVRGIPFGYGIPADGSVTNIKLALTAVNTNNIALSAITSTLLAPSAVANVHIQSNAVQTHNIAGAAVTPAKLDRSYASTGNALAYALLFGS